MCKCSCNCPVKKYMLTGRGIGLKIVTLMSLLVGIIVGIVTPVILTDMLNEDNSLNDFIDRLPIVTIEKGKIVDPIYNKDVWYVPIKQANGSDLKIIADTTVDSVESIPADTAVYITARNIYTPTDVITLPPELSTVITHDVMREGVKKGLWVIGFMSGIMIFAVGIIGFLIAYIPMMFIGWIMNRRLTVDTWGRIFAWPWSIMYTIATILALFFNVTLSPLYLVLIAALITWIIGVMMNDKTQECDCSSNENNCICCAHKGIVFETTPVETASEDVEIEEVSTPASTQATIVTTTNRTKKATVKPKNVPTSRKGKKKK